MTKMNCRIIFLFFAAVFASFISSEKAYGVLQNSSEDMAARRQENQTQKQENICEKITERSEKFQSRLEMLTEKIKTQKQERLQNWEEKKDERDAKLGQFRTRRDVNLEEHFKMLSERAQTDEQDQAVAEFEKRVRAAIETRRNSIDEAISAFRSGVDAAISGRKDDLSTAANKFEEAQKEAFDTAVAECQKGTNAATVRTNLKNSLKTAKNNLGVQRKEAEKIRTQAETLIQARRAAFEKANADFKTEMEAAKIELKKVFPDA